MGMSPVSSYRELPTELIPSGLLDEYGVRLNVVGRIELLPENVRNAVHKAEGMTRHNDRSVILTTIILALSC